MAKLRTYVCVDGEWYGPDDGEIPAGVAAKITNPKAWEGGVLPGHAVDEADPEPQGQETADDGADSPTPEADSQPAGDGAEKPAAPPRTGRGSSAEAWAKFAGNVGVQVPAGASRDDIIAACEQAGVIEPENR